MLWDQHHELMTQKRAKFSNRRRCPLVEAENDRNQKKFHRSCRAMGLFHDRLRVDELHSGEASHAINSGLCLFFYRVKCSCNPASSCRFPTSIRSISSRSPMSIEHCRVLSNLIRSRIERCFFTAQRIFGTSYRSHFFRVASSIS